MTHFNPNIELSVHDMELIEDALHHAKQELSKPGGVTDDAALVKRSVREIDDLLGHLHNQKVFYRPHKKTPYVSG